MTQTLISEWVCESEGVMKKLLKHFFLDKFDAKWSEEPPTGIVWHKSVVISNQRVVICSSVLPGKSIVPEYRLPESLIPLLKSNIQKCVRRKIHDKAMKSAYQLMNIVSDKGKEIGMSNFLRRLSIISLEDTVVISAIQTVIWFMVAHSKGYTLDEKQKRYLLGVLYILIDNKTFSRMQWKSTNKDIVYNDFVKSLTVRKAYGGMKGDINMIDDAIKHYSYNKPANIPIVRMKVTDLSFNKDDIELSAVDFHCYPHIISRLVILFPEYSEEHLKQVIWDESSGVNIRLPAYAGNVYLRNGLFRRLRPHNKVFSEIYEELVKICLRILGNLSF